MRTRTILMVFAVFVLAVAMGTGVLLYSLPAKQSSTSTVRDCLSATGSSSQQITFQGEVADYAYQIPVPCEAQMVVSYYFPPDHPGGSAPLQATIGPVTNTSSGWTYVACTSFNGTTNFCPGISISASPSVLKYYGGLNASVTYTIEVLSTVKQGAYRLSLPGMQCSPIELVVGTVVPDIPSNLLSPFAVHSCLMAVNFRPDIKIVRTVNLLLLDPSTTSTHSAGICGFPQYILDLASRVQSDPQFTAIGEKHNQTFTFEYASEQGPTTGTANGRAYYAPPAVEMAFYSYGSHSQTYCPGDSRGTPTVLGAIWVRVPKNPDGSFDLANMSLFYTPGLFRNGTAIGGG